MPRRFPLLGPTTLLCLLSVTASAQHSDKANCKDLPGKQQLREAMRNAAENYGTIGGLFQGTRMWGAIVNRDGQVCTLATTTADPSRVWPGSRAIAMAKAYTANAFSLSTSPVAGIAGFPLSTAQLYTFSQPGHSLFGLNQSNLLNTDCLGKLGGENHGSDEICGGIITFGGGVAIYQGGRIIGGLGISGDTACADHEIARNTRDDLGFNPPGGATADDISYSSEGGASVFTHPLCPNTFHNGASLGDELAASGY